MKKLNVNINGNKKLQNTNNVRFMIWNLPAVKTCPFRTSMCEKSCYARKAERVYPQVLPSRERNFRDSLEDDFAGNMIYTVEALLNSRAYKGKTVYFRIHESGDFYNLEYAKKWVEVARHFSEDNRIIFEAYTKSISFMIAAGYGTPAWPTNFIIRASVWDDTKKDALKLIDSYNFQIYTAFPAQDFEKLAKGYTECKCEDCATCGKCYKRDDHKIAVRIH